MHRVTPDRTRPIPGQNRNDWLFRFNDELKGVRRANYPQLTKGMNSSWHSWWVGFKVGMDIFDVSCLFSWSQAPGDQVKCCHTRAKYFSTSKTWTKMTAAVRYGFGVARCGPVRTMRLVVTPLVSLCQCVFVFVSFVLSASYVPSAWNKMEWMNELL